MAPFALLKGFRKGPKGLSSDVIAIEWCPTMDLLALVTEDRQLMVFRAEGWQRLSHASFNQPVTCLTWRPDGQVVAAGHADGAAGHANDSVAMSHARAAARAICERRFFFQCTPFFACLIAASPRTQPRGNCSQ